MIGSVEVLEAKIASGRMTASAFAIASAFTFGILEHGLDDEVAVLQVVVVGASA